MLKNIITGTTYKPKGKTSLLQKMYFPYCRRASGFSRGVSFPIFHWLLQWTKPLFGVQPKRTYWQMKLQTNGFLEIDFDVPSFVTIICQSELVVKLDILPRMQFKFNEKKKYIMISASRRLITMNFDRDEKNLKRKSIAYKLYFLNI